MVDLNWLGSPDVQLIACALLVALLAGLNCWGIRIHGHWSIGIVSLVGVGAVIGAGLICSARCGSVCPHRSGAGAVTVVGLLGSIVLMLCVLENRNLIYQRWHRAARRKAEAQ
jgi:hypothetical protein